MDEALIKAFILAALRLDCSYRGSFRCSDERYNSILGNRLAQQLRLKGHLLSGLGRGVGRGFARWGSLIQQGNNLIV